MDPLLLVLIILLAFLTLGFLVWFTIHKSKEKERLLLLEKGIDPSDLPERSTFSFPWLKLGCVITSSVIGLILALILELPFEDSSTIGMFLFGGIGLIIAHYLDKPNEKF